MGMCNDAFQFESEHGDNVELFLSNYFEDDSPFADMRLSVASSPKSDWDELEIYSSWKEQADNRFGGGSPAPSIPRSQRQYDGDNFHDYCEVLRTR